MIHVLWFGSDGTASREVCRTEVEVYRHLIRSITQDSAAATCGTAGAYGDIKDATRVLNDAVAMGSKTWDYLLTGETISVILRASETLAHYMVMVAETSPQMAYYEELYTGYTDASAK